MGVRRELVDIPGTTMAGGENADVTKTGFGEVARIPTTYIKNPYKRNVLVVVNPEHPDSRLKREPISNRPSGLKSS